MDSFQTVIIKVLSGAYDAAVVAAGAGAGEGCALGGALSSNDNVREAIGFQQTVKERDNSRYCRGNRCLWRC
jgi:hypothetical protein